MILKYCQWFPLLFFDFEAVKVTGSLLLSFAGGDTACLVGPTHSDPAWAALQHGIPAECKSGQLNFTITGFMLLVFMTTHPFQFHVFGPHESATEHCTGHFDNVRGPS